MLYLLMLDCIGGGLYVVCAKSVTVTLLYCFVCLSLSFGFGKNFAFLFFYMKEVPITIRCS